MRYILPFLLTLSACSQSHDLQPPPPALETPLGCNAAPDPNGAGQQVPFQLGLGGNWCWIAAASMVSEMTSDPRAQCDIASEIMQQDCCGTTGRSTTQCDVTGQVRAALSDVLGLGGEWADHQLQESEIQAEITSGSPIVLHVTSESTPQNAHIVLITHYAPYEGVQYYEVLDPAIGTINLTYDQMSSGYNIQGDWVWDWTLHNIRTAGACGVSE